MHTSDLVGDSNINSKTDHSRAKRKPRLVSS